MMKNTLLLCCFFIPLFWHCSGNNTASQGESAAETATADTSEREAARPEQWNRRNRTPFEKTLQEGTVSFHLSSPNVPEQNTLVAASTGLEMRNDTFQVMVEGLVTDARLADLDQDGFPEVYAFARSTGSDSTAYVHTFVSYRNRSYGIAGVSELPAPMAEGFNGHGRFYFDEGALKRSFPLYAEGKPTGKHRVIRYELQQGEASFILKPASMETKEEE